jgi:hypothetical protein
MRMTRAIPLGLALVGALAAWPARADERGPRVADVAEGQQWGQLTRMIAARADVTAPQADGMTALHWAAYHDAPAAAQQLLRAGATADVVSRYGVTPLSLACTTPAPTPTARCPVERRG